MKCRNEGDAGSPGDIGELVLEEKTEKPICHLLQRQSVLYLAVTEAPMSLRKVLIIFPVLSFRIRSTHFRNIFIEQQ